MTTIDNLSLFDGLDDEGGAKDARVRTQLERVYDEMSRAGYEWTLQGLSIALSYPEASIAARIRDLRKPRFGGHTVVRRHLGNGLYSYRLVPSECGLLDGSGPRSAKADARARLTERLNAQPIGHLVVSAADLREILR